MNPTVTFDGWYPVAKSLPAPGQKVDWISPGGAQIDGGVYQGGSVWHIPVGGSNAMHIYYLPVFWRPSLTPSPGDGLSALELARLARSTLLKKREYVGSHHAREKQKLLIELGDMEKLLEAECDKHLSAELLADVDAETAEWWKGVNLV